MPLGSIVGGYLAARGRSNLPVWDGRRRGMYEVWYITLNSPADEAAFWLRYTLDAPDHGEAFGELWGHFFDGRDADRRFGLRRRFENRDLAVAGDDGLIRLGQGGSFSEGTLRGELEDAGHRIEWSLRYEPSPTVFYVAPRWLRPLVARKRTHWAVPNRDVRFTGTVTVDGRSFELRDAPGQQGHIHGRQHANRWTWAHCNAFDGGRSALLEGVAAEVPFAGRARLLTLVYVHYEGRDYLCNALPVPALKAKSRIAFPVWELQCMDGDLTFVARVEADPNQMLQVRYEDPDGALSWCCNSELASLKLDVLRRGAVIDTLTATRTAHLEFGDRARRDGIRLAHGS